MSSQVDTAYVYQYRNNVSMLVQQKGSRLRPFVRVEPQNSEFEFYDRIGATDAVEITGRHQDTPLVSTPHDRRCVYLRDYDWADLIDRQDKLRMLIDPTSAYAMNAVFAMGRKMDDAIIGAAFDTAYSGKTGQITVPFPAGNQVAVNYVESGSAANGNLTIGKIRRAKEILDAYDNDPDEARIMTCTANSLHSLLRNIEITSQDYNVVKALVEGKVDTFMGFKFVRTELLGLDGSSDRRCIAWAKSGLHLGIWNDITTKISERADKSYATQVYVKGTFGATRVEEGKVIKVWCR